MRLLGFLIVLLALMGCDMRATPADGFDDNLGSAGSAADEEPAEEEEEEPAEEEEEPAEEEEEEPAEEERSRGGFSGFGGGDGDGDGGGGGGGFDPSQFCGTPFEDMLPPGTCD